MTRQEIEDQITLNIGDTSTNTVTQVLSAIDIVLRELRSRVEWQGRISEGFIRTTSGRYQYALEPDVYRLQGNFYIPDDATTLEMVSADSFNDSIPQVEGTGVPSVAMLASSFPVGHQPHSYVRVASSSASDTMDVTIYGKSYGLITSEAVTLPGSATNGILTTKYFSEVYRIIAESAPVGTITASSNTTAGDTTLPTVAAAGGVTVGTIAIGATESTNVINPGSFVRIAMSTDVAGDRGQIVRLEGYRIDTTTRTDRLFHRMDVTTGGSDFPTTNATTSVVSSIRFTEITAITKAWDATYRLLVTTDPGSTVCQIGPNSRSAEYPQVRFYNIPNGATIHYRYIPAHIKLSNDTDIPQVPELYHQLVAEWAEKLVRGWHSDKAGVVTLSGNPAFDRAVSNAQVGSRISPMASSLVLGGGWRNNMPRSRHDFPITQS